jgi:type IV pilus biogenesis protein CpaD/CtpE
MRRATAVLLAAAAAGLAGCAGFGGGNATPTTSTGTRSGTAAKVAQAERTHEYPAATGPPPRPASGPTSPAGATAVRWFASRYINWSAATVTRQMQVLALASVGQARSAMALAAAQTQNDYELRRGGIANRGVVEAVAPLPGRRNEFVVVTQERTTATNTSAYAGLRPAWHVAVAAVTEVAPGQWAVSRWQPES